MDSSVHKLFLYEEIKPLLFYDEYSCFSTDNAPMNNGKVVVHKGMDNKVIFRAFDPDRKPYNVQCLGDVYIRVTDVSTKRIVLERKGRLGSTTGMIYFDITESDLADIDSDTYSVVVFAQEQFIAGAIGVGEYTSKPFYVDYNSNIKMTFVVTEQGQRDPIPSVEMNPAKWTPFRHTHTSYVQPVQAYYSEAIAGSRVRNSSNGIHTLSLIGDNFHGTLEIYATLDLTPPATIESPSWFKVSLTSIQNIIIMNGFTGNEAFTFAANIMWLKLVMTPSTEVSDSGMLSKVTVRA